MKYKYNLPELPYAYDALEPYIDAQTMEIHHTKHHQAYINNLNAALENYPELQNLELTQILTNLDSVPLEIRNTVRNNGGGTFNHDMFWLLMKNNNKNTVEPVGKSKEEIIKTFGTFDNFKDKFNNASKSVFGSGWSWLVINKAGDLEIMTTPNQDSPISSGNTPILGLDVWEHAYYLKYQNRRPDYINAWWHVINWNQVEENLLNIR